MGASLGAPASGAPAGLNVGGAASSVGAIAGGAATANPLAVAGGIASLPKALKGGGGGPDPIINAISSGASSVINPVTQQILADPLSFQKRLGLSVVTGGLGAIGDILKENSISSNARKLKQTPANSNASATAASRGPGMSFQAPDPNTQRLQALQARTHALIARDGSPQLKAGSLGGGGVG